MPTLDDEQNWILESFSENATHTHLVVSRPLQTTDADDNDITVNLNAILFQFSNVYNQQVLNLQLNHQLYI